MKTFLIMVGAATLFSLLTVAGCIRVSGNCSREEEKEKSDELSNL